MRKLLAIVLTVLLMLTPIYSFADVVFNDYEGNDSFENKVDPPVNKVFYFNDEGEILTTESAIKVEFEVSEDGKYLSFESDGILVTMVSIKGGNGYRVYDFGDGENSYSGMRSPDNDGNNIPDISHYSFEFDFEVIVPPPPPPPPPDDDDDDDDDDDEPPVIKPPRKDTDNGAIKIHKFLDTNENKIKDITEFDMLNVEFALLDEDKVTIIRTGKTDEFGNLEFNNLDKGIYYLKELTGYKNTTDNFDEDGLLLVNMDYERTIEYEIGNIRIVKEYIEVIEDEIDIIEVPEELPQTGEAVNMSLYGIGTLITALGIGLRFKK